MLKKWIIYTLVVLVLAYFMPTVHVDNWLAAIIAAGAIGLLNTFVRPILLFLTFPISLMTMGLFVLIVNTILVMVADYYVAGFLIDGFIPALIFSTGMSVLVWIFD